MDTRERFLAAALHLFADKGFYGASMDRIAAELGLTKQALIHHFGTKKKLYGAVLEQISQRLLAVVRSEQAAGVGASQVFANAIEGVFRHTLDHPEDTQLLMRELLDNRGRAENAHVWYLKPFLEELRDRLLRVPRWKSADPEVAATHVYQLIGAINYFAVSITTLEQMYSRKVARQIAAAYPERLRTLARAGPYESSSNRRG